MAPSEKTRLTQLEDVDLAYILESNQERLSLKDFGSLSAVSKGFNALCRNPDFYTIAHIPNVSTAAAFLWLSQRCKKTKVLRIPGALYEENAEKAIGRRLPKSACFQSSFETLILNCGPTLKVLEIAEVRYDDPHWPLKLFSLIGRNCTQLEQLRVCIDPWGFEPLADFFIRLANVQGTVCAHWATGLSKLKLVVLSYTSELAGTTAVTAGVQRLEGANFSQGVEVLVHGQDLTGLIANLRIDGDRRSLVRWMFDEEVDPDCSPNFGEREHATASSGPCLELSAALNSYSIATRIEDLRWLAVASRCPPLKGIGFIIYLLGSGSVYHKLELS